MASNIRLPLPFTTVSPAAPSGVVPTIFPVTNAGPNAYYGLDDYSTVLIDAVVLGATGGTLDIYFQTSLLARQGVAGGRWYDIAHLPQIAAGAAAARYSMIFTRAKGIAPTTPSTISDVTVNGTSGLAANTILSQVLGDSIRMVMVAGAGTTAGASLVIDGSAYTI
jgi:hypothetical protein